MRVYTTKDDVEGLYQEVDRVMEGFTLPRGYEWNKGERHSQYSRESQAMKFAVIMAVVFVFLLMGVLFESVILPFAVIFSIPFSFLGVYWGLWLTGTTMDFMSNVGAIVLIGVVVNNAIVLVDMINRLRQTGMDRAAGNYGGGSQSLSSHFDDDLHDGVRVVSHGDWQQYDDGDALRAAGNYDDGWADCVNGVDAVCGSPVLRFTG